MKILASLVLPLAALAAACGSSDDPCKGVSGTCVPIHAGASATDIQTALINVQPNSTIAFAAGTYDLDVDLSLTVDNVTIQGEGQDKSILSFKNQISGAQGLLVTSHTGFTMHDIAIEDAKGDCLKMEGVDGVKIQHVRTEWTGGPKATNGAYGIYPVQCAHVLVENSIAKGASDTGIYVGQSSDVIIRGNDVEYNVAGIECENTNRADVYMNLATHNTGGLLVFNLPGLQVENASQTRFYMNTSVDNNTDNFAPSGNIVGMVPTGSGLIALAAHNVEVFNNTFDNEHTMNLGIASYTIIGTPNDANYDVYPDTFYIHDNVFTGTSTMPTGPLGGLVVLTLSELTPPQTIVPDMIWDGVVDPTKALATDPTQLMPQYNICIKNNGDADFANLAYPNGDAHKPSKDLTPFNCMHDPLPAVTIPGV